MTITSHDVARLAGVSQPTVSRALRGDTRVSDSTRAKVVRAADVLGYVPSQLGRSLSTRSTRQVAMVADLDNPLYPMLVGPLHDRFAELGYRMVLLAERGDDRTTYERLLDRSVDAAVLTTPLLNSSLATMLASKSIPFVELNRSSGVDQADAVTADNHGGGQACARLLLELGHRRIGAVLGPAETSSSRDREAGFRAALDEAGVTLPSKWVARGAFTYEDGVRGFAAVMSASPRPTALFCVNDMVAVGALNRAIVDGVSIPDEVAVVGFDDLPIASWPSFRLTTVKVDFAQMARAAADLVVRRLAGQTSPEQHAFATRLVLRSTHAG